MILALNRCDAMIGFLDYFFTPYRKEQFFNILLYISYLVSLAVWVLYMMPGFQAYTQGVVTRSRHQSSNNNFIKWHEVSLFIQAFIICGYKTGMTLLKNYTDFADPNNKNLYFIFWCVNYFEIGYNAWLYIAFNKKLRREIRALFSSKTTVSSIQVKPTQVARNTLTK
uniref:Very-long-chain 3-oxoacyl-CoA synthase n=1 Tax=Acrobeloides nanus TaxID=290746 RepID=A0A914EJT3_9BILA